MLTTASTPLRCDQCGWLNQKGQSLCFSCNAPLSHTVADQHAAAHAHEDQPPYLSRILASLIDLSTMTTITVAVVMAWIKLGELDTAQAYMPWITWSALGLLTIGLFLPAFMDAWSQGSFGKRQMGLRIVTHAGKRPGILRLCIRHGLKFGLNLAFPGAFTFLQHLIFGHTGLHGWITRTRVVGALSIKTAATYPEQKSQLFSKSSGN
jgi:uncharacterized RDD family membrane protein YckC